MDIICNALCSGPREAENVLFAFLRWRSRYVDGSAAWVKGRLEMMASLMFGNDAG